MRVYELAKEYEIKATEFVDLIQTFGVDINSHMSGLDDAQIADIRYRMDSKDIDEVEDIPEEVKKKSLISINFPATKANRYEGFGNGSSQITSCLVGLSDNIPA